MVILQRDHILGKAGIDLEVDVELAAEPRDLHPFERPILILAKQAAVGRPTENIEALLDEIG